RYITPSPNYAMTRVPFATSANDQRIINVYNGANQLTQVTSNPAGTVTNYTYDNVGNLVRTDKAFGTTDARTIRTRYDAKGRVTQELTGEGSAALDALGASSTLEQI